jgi:threonine-phosphate decarboxylase
LGTGIDLGLLRKNAHSPSYFALSRSTGADRADLVDFCIPCNPYFPTKEMFADLGRNLETILKFYPSDADTITAELCSTLRLHPQTITMANGSTELLTWIDHLLVEESLATPIPTFGRWTDQPLETGKRVDMYRLREEDDFRLDVDEFIRFVRHRRSRVAVICNPNNPDGGYVPRREVVRMLDELADLDLVVVDESFIDFMDAEPRGSVADEAMVRPNVIVLKSLGKNFGLHGIRFGYLVANPALAGKVRKALPKWNLNSFAEAVVFLLKEHHDAYLDSLRLLARDRREMIDTLLRFPTLKVFTASQGNFVLVRLPDGYDGSDLRDHLIARHGVFVRECGNKLGVTSQFLRLVVRPREDLARLTRGLADYLSDSQPDYHAGLQVQGDLLGRPRDAAPHPTSRTQPSSGRIARPLPSDGSIPLAPAASSGRDSNGGLPWESYPAQPMPTPSGPARPAAPTRPMDGYSSNGYSTNGHGSNGHAAATYPPNGYPANGNGYSPNGNGYTANGHGTNGHRPHRAPPNGNGWN